MKKGRPLKSPIRQHIIEILHYLPKGYGYQIAKIYNTVFSPVTQRSIYYHLRKGLETGEILQQGVEQEKGRFSWGELVEKTYYTLGEKAQPQENEQLKEFFKK